MGNKSIFGDINAEEVTILEDGKYSGKICDISRDTEKFDYVRYKIEVKGEKTTKGEPVSLSLSFPTRVTFLKDGSPSSQHAKFLATMGIELTTDLILEDAIFEQVGKEIQFLVNQKTTKKGTFSEIVDDSVKLVK